MSVVSISASRKSSFSKTSVSKHSSASSLSFVVALAYGVLAARMSPISKRSVELA